MNRLCAFINYIFRNIIYFFLSPKKIGTELKTIKVIKYDKEELMSIILYIYNELYNEGISEVESDDDDIEDDTIHRIELINKINNELINNCELYKEIIEINNNEKLANKILSAKIYNEYMENLELYSDILTEGAHPSKAELIDMIPLKNRFKLH